MTLKAVALSVLLIFLLQLILGICVMQQIQGRLGIKFSGTFWPIPFLPTFYSSNAKFVWKNRVTVLSGNVKIDYNALPWLVRNSIRIKIKGRNIHAQLAGDWSKMQGVENISVDFFDADVDVARKGLGEIYLVRAESPSFHFAIQKN